MCGTVPLYRHPRGKRGSRGPCDTHEAALRLHPGEQAERDSVCRRHQRRRPQGLAAPTGEIEGFTKRYGVHRLVFAEFHETMSGAITREKRMKKWRRAWKLLLIERDNPSWRDLYEAYVPHPGPPLARG
jgi:predicted GIY-YIG superfamily endonuclease